MNYSTVLTLLGNIQEYEKETAQLYDENEMRKNYHKGKYAHGILTIHVYTTKTTGV